MTDAQPVRVEIAVENLAGVRIADAAGASRVELGTGLSGGGLTPSAALIEAAVGAVTDTEVHVLIRPRTGDFRYAPEEIELIRTDIEWARRLGAHGVVFGVLDADGNVDRAANAELRAAADGMQATFHRAFDICTDPYSGFDTLLELGFTRLLTSGRQLSVLDGAPLIARLVNLAAGRIDVMACGGLRADNARRVLELTGVRDLHAAVRLPVPGLPPQPDNEVSFAESSVPTGFDHFATDPAGVAALIEAAAN
ncbi:copper homeostasis protein CutC [Nocardia yamanashiensis]|uniref:copper homeostasis protein CutC n=1 Tax=Nocardia yamanashiensis TaxID=209247 RepID=UPI001E546E11|nr:copper homeostasis protein CutC [Nocardia yamanashiensis]UGT40752.1 copper homeostasis protein CutC [Nocardia yamanashiensis]